MLELPFPSGRVPVRIAGGASQLTIRRPAGVGVRLEILEFALHDATNGTARRSRESFERALSQAAELLGSLGLRTDGAGAAALGWRADPVPMFEAA